MKEGNVISKKRAAKKESKTTPVKKVMTRACTTPKKDHEFVEPAKKKGGRPKKIADKKAKVDQPQEEEKHGPLDD